MEEELGRGFWLKLLGICLAIGVGGLLLFGLLGTVWYAWGFFGTLIFFGGILLIWAWIYDHKQAKPADY
jgi:hypothetical protein